MFFFEASFYRLVFQILPFDFQYIYLPKALASETYFKMGNSCGPSGGISQYDVNFFINKYGKDTMLNLIKENVRKEEILKKMPQIAEKYRLNIHEAKIVSIRQINVVEVSIIHDIQEEIKGIERGDTGQVHKAENHYGQAAQDLMGRLQIQQDFAELRKKTLAVYQNEEKQTKERIQTDFQVYVAQLEKQKNEKFVEFQGLSNQSRQAIRSEGKKKFKKEIKFYRQEVSHQIEQGKVVNMVHLKQDYSGLHPTRQIEELKRKAQKLMKNGRDTIIGTDILGVNSKQILPAPGFWKCC